MLISTSARSVISATSTIYAHNGGGPIDNLCFPPIAMISHIDLTVVCSLKHLTRRPSYMVLRIIKADLVSNNLSLVSYQHICRTKFKSQNIRCQPDLDLLHLWTACRMKRKSAGRSMAWLRYRWRTPKFDLRILCRAFQNDNTNQCLLAI